MPLRFLALPSLVQSEILPNLDPLDLLLFSSLSAKTKAILQRSSFKISLHWSFYYQSFRLELETSLSRYCVLGVQGDISRRDDHQEMMNFNGFNLIRDGDCWVIVLKERSERLIAYEQLTKLIFDVFNVQECHLKAWALNGAGFICNYTKTLKTMLLTNILPCVDFELILKELHIEEFRISSASERLYYSGPLRMDTLKIDDYHWIQKKSFWNMECKRVEFFNFVSLSIREIREIISKWMTGSMKNLEELKIHLMYQPSWFVRDLLTDIESFKISENEFRVRRVDGTTARINWKQPHRFVMTIDKN